MLNRDFAQKKALPSRIISRRSIIIFILLAVSVIIIAWCLFIGENTYYPDEIYCESIGRGHLQGMTIDDQKRVMYFSFTNSLIKTDLAGRVIGTVTDIPGHLGDITYYQGKIYGSMELKDQNTFYVAIFDGDKVKNDIPCEQIMRTFYLEDIVEDFTDPLESGEIENSHDSKGHRYGCAGVDGVTVGTLPGGIDNEIKLMIAYAIYDNTARSDNDYQIILQYSLKDILDKSIAWQGMDSLHKSGSACENKFFVYTGNTQYGAQNLEYDKDTKDYWLGAYKGSKPQFPNYTLFLIDGKIAPYIDIIRGQNDPLELGLTLRLSEHGSLHRESGTYGFDPPPGINQIGFGLISLGNNLFYIADIGYKYVDDALVNFGSAKLYRLDRSAYTFTPLS